MSRLSYEDVGMAEPEEGIIQFEILPEHLKLLRGLQLCWTEDWGVLGGLQTNPGRPYGTHDYEGDMKKLTELELDETTARKLHRGAAMALQIALKTGKFKAGIFRAPKYSQDWHEWKPKKGKKGEDTDGTG